MSNLSQNIINYIEQNRHLYLSMSHQIHERPELGNEEVFASRLLSDQLKSHHFKIEKNIAKHPTGFIATYDSGKEGPTIAYLAEYDALPGLGHACGHNIIGTSSVLAGISLSKVIDQIGGKVIVLGCPAEEGGINGSAKATYVKAGIIDNIDIALMVHPGHETYVTVPSLAVDVFDVKFYGRSAHASENAFEAVNALDAMLSFFNGVSMLRQQIKKTDKVHGVILNGGEAANIIPDFTHARFYTRATSRKELDILTDKVRKIAEGAAIQTGGTYELRPIQNGVNEFVINKPLDELFRKHAEQVGEEVIDDDFGFGSTDTGNVSHIVPTIHPHIKIGPSNLVGHTKEFCQAAASTKGDKALINGAKILASMGLELIENVSLRNEIIEHHQTLRENLL
ncbi:M20 family metallopeptidase [Mammaliicoccus sciuri]|uniref:M20 family metallopeptidase n=1 Tax=Mammaliicoccus sciuri TaxID=1296 RepID=UPI00265BF1BC|nr:M20 family metallopeptidase [Mammaliicoccus sciuri]MDO0958010.1 M20 family metallopeptidase [Mammaliicoccus sciuri]MEB7050551.1 M20 family metallopeptidase [Mammaliicoccus sciuri]